MDAVKYFEIKNRMTKNCTIACNKCGLDADKHDGLGCSDFEMKYPEKAVAIAEKWEKEHQLKTRKQVLFERFPDANTNDAGEPLVCAAVVGLIEKDCLYYESCVDCWNDAAPDKYQV